MKDQNKTAKNNLKLYFSYQDFQVLVKIKIFKNEVSEKKFKETTTTKEDEK